MKKLLLSVIGFSLLASFTINTKHLSGTEDMVFECPECKEKFLKSMKELQKAYLKETTVACDKFKEGKITRAEYDKALSEARSKNSKPESDCMATYNKCCLKESKEIIDKEEKNKESI